MIGLPGLLSRQFEDVDAATVSSICIRTAQPKYLVFTGNVAQPRFVVQFGTYALLKRVFDHLAELYVLLPGQVPKPLFMSQDLGEESVFVQEGLPGRPWFNIQSSLATERSCLTLRQQALSALAKFQGVVSTQPHWHDTVASWQVLQDTATQYKQVVGQTPEGFDEIVETHVQILRPLGEIQCFNQHGDFCINNMLIDGESVGVIDFEHFGLMQTPMHDEFLLVDSLMAFAPSSCAGLGQESWAIAVEQSAYAQLIGEQALPAFLLQFYLWWGIETAHQPLRTRKSAFYAVCVEAFCRTSRAGGHWQDSCPWVVARDFG